MLAPLDYLVIAFYVLFMGGLGWYFRRDTADSSEFFRGGGRMPWWMVGASVFMSGFSAWTFTGAAGVAYNHGIVVLMIYWGNALCLFLAAAVFAAWMRQTRAVVVMEVVRERLGRTNEQFAVATSVPLSVISSAISLYGMAIFLAPVFHWNLTLTIVISGILVILTSTLGGAWAVVAGDFMQAMLLVPVTLIAAAFALEATGGLGPLLSNLPKTHLDLTASASPGFGLLWVVAVSIERIWLQNGISSAWKFLVVRDGGAARRAAVLAGFLFLAGSSVWFIPPLATRSLGLDLVTRFPQLSSPGEGAYVAMAVDLLPMGLLGLLVVGIVGATLSAMDHGLNRNAGICVRSLYVPLLRRSAGEKEQVLAGRVCTILLGVVIILLALLYSTWREMSIFNLMFNFMAMLAAPIAVPMVWCFFTRRTPDWATWSSSLVGFSVSAIVGWLPRQPAIAQWIDEHTKSGFSQWLTANEFSVIVLLNFSLCTLWILVATALWPVSSPARKAEIDSFFTKMRKPLTKEESLAQGVDRTAERIAHLCLIYAAFLVILALIPNSLRGHLSLGFCAIFFAVTAYILRRLSRREIARFDAETRNTPQPSRQKVA
jgi:Na+/proline symporter